LVRYFIWKDLRRTRLCARCTYCIWYWSQQCFVYKMETTNIRNYVCGIFC